MAITPLLFSHDASTVEDGGGTHHCWWNSKTWETRRGSTLDANGRDNLSEDYDDTAGSQPYIMQ